MTHAERDGVSRPNAKPNLIGSIVIRARQRRTAFVMPLDSLHSTRIISPPRVPRAPTSWTATRAVLVSATGNGAVQQLKADRIVKLQHTEGATGTKA